MSWLFLISFFFSSAYGQSSTDGVLINADSMDRDMAKGIVRLTGHVQVIFQGQHLSADKAELNLNTQSVVAEGHVIVTNPKVHVEGGRVVFNYKQNTGVIYDGFVQSGQVVFEGSVIEKAGESHYIATNAEYTACDTCPAGWSFSGRTIDAEIGGYATIQRPLFRVGGIPILIMPSLIVPLKSSRQSGFLVPFMDFSGKGGVGFGESYFWAIDRSQDLTLTARRYEFRGFKFHDDYRYVLSETSRGRFQSAWIADRAFKNDLKTSQVPDRWFLSYSHLFDLPEGFVQRVDAVSVSDLRYTRDFPDELKGHGDPALEKKASLTKSSDNHYASLEADLYTNLLKDYAQANNDDAIHRLPEIRYSLKERQLFENGPYFGLNLDYVNFASEKFNYQNLKTVTDSSNTPVAKLLKGPNATTGLGPYDEIPQMGPFNPRTDLYRAGQRVDIKPTLTYPFRIAGRFDVLPVVAYRETQYRFTDVPDTNNFNSTAARRYVETDLRVKTEFSRVFGSLEDPQANRWKHSFEPEIGYAQIPWMRRPNHPFFGDFHGLKYSRQYDPISDADLVNPSTGMQFDYEDRTYEKQVVDLVLTNRLTRKTWVNGQPEYKTAALFRLNQSYDLNEARSRTHPHPWSSTDGLLDLRFDHFETYTIASYNPYARVTNLSSRVRLLTTPKNFVQLSYTHNYILTDQDTVTPNSETQNVGFGAGMRMQYLEAVGQIDYSEITKKIQSWSYLINIRPPGRCWVITLDHKQIVGGDRQFKGSLSFDFGGENKKGFF